MSQPRRTIERLIHQGALPISDAEAAATHLRVYPDKHTWLKFFDTAALIIGAVALVLSLVFFIAYNWLNMGKLGKFALVEGALILTIALYAVLVFQRKFKLIQPLLLLIASVITGSLLALFGQVYQTGADTWQLFVNWALLILPWVLIARLPALWLLWLGLLNICLILYFNINGVTFVSADYQVIWQVGTLASVNFIAFMLWLLSVNPSHSGAARHWSSYIVGLLSSYFISHLAIVSIFEDSATVTTLVTFGLWLSWCAFMYWRFARWQRDVLMLTYLCFSIIVIVMFWAVELLPDDLGAGSFLGLALLLIGMSSMAVMWLRGLANLDNLHQHANDSHAIAPHPLTKGGDHEA